MTYMERNLTTKRVVKQSIAFPVAQLEWIRAEAERQEHGNLSRIVQDAIKAYRDDLEIRRERAIREVERIAS